MPADFSQLPPDRRAAVEAAYARMMANLPYERTVISGRDALSELERLRSLGKGWPVMVGAEETLEGLAEHYGLFDPAVFQPPEGAPPPRPPAEILDAAAGLRFPEDLAQWPGATPPEDLLAPVGDWPEEPSIMASPEGLLCATYDTRTGQPLDQVHVLFIPTGRSWEVPAFLRWGDWNACPPPEHHVAALRRWHEAYGAELVGIGADTLDLHVQRPPRSREEALAVARDIYAYCPDNVDQGCGTLSALAAGMVMQPWWSFWWD